MEMNHQNPVVAQDVDRERLNVQILDSMDDLVRVVDTSHQVIFMNVAMRKAGFPEITQNISSIDYMQGSEHYIPTFPLAFQYATKQTITRELKINGRYYSVKSSPVLDVVGNIIANVEVFRDITSETHTKQELFKANKRMADDMKLARNIQYRLLPQKGEYQGISIDYYYEPSYNLSGDLFDVVPIDDHLTAIYIADVVGHGVGASIMTMFVKQSMTSIISDQGGEIPSKTLYEIRHRLEAMNVGTELYFTLFYGVLDHKKRVFRYSNAGHNCPPLHRSDYGVKLLSCSGAPISPLFSHMTYTDRTIDLKEEDLLLFYTDGITETKGFDRMEFGQERLIDIVKTNKTGIISKVIHATQKFRWGEIEDDIALLMVKIK